MDSKVRHLTSLFTYIQDQFESCDVTFVLDNSSIFAAHKLVISSCSFFLKTIFEQSQDENQIIYLPDVPEDLMENLVHLLYFGYASVAKHQFDDFKKLGRRLGIESLKEHKMEENMNSTNILATSEIKMTKVRPQPKVFSTKDVRMTKILEKGSNNIVKVSSQTKQSLIQKSLKLKMTCDEITKSLKNHESNVTTNNNLKQMEEEVKPRFKEVILIEPCSPESQKANPGPVHDEPQLQIDSETRGKVECPHCALKLVSQYAVQAHVYNHHSQEVPDKNCPVEECHFKAKSRTNIEQHRLDVHAVKHDCNLCDFKAPEKMMRNHYLTYHKVDLLPCKICPYVTKDLGSLRKHMATHDPKCAPKKCEKCNFVVTNNERATLDLHMNEMHDVPKIPCDQCHFISPSEKILLLHVKTHHIREGTKEKENGDLQCAMDNCFYVTKHYHLLEKHQGFHEGTNVKCDLCNFQTSKEQLRKEMSEHKIKRHGIKPEPIHKVMETEIERRRELEQLQPKPRKNIRKPIIRYW